MDLKKLFHWKHKNSGQVIDQENYSKLDTIVGAKENFEETEDEPTHTVGESGALMAILAQVGDAEMGVVGGEAQTEVAESNNIFDGGTGEGGGASGDFSADNSEADLSNSEGSSDAGEGDE